MLPSRAPQPLALTGSPFHSRVHMLLSWMELADVIQAGVLRMGVARLRNCPYWTGLGASPWQHFLDCLTLLAMWLVTSVGG